MKTRSKSSVSPAILLFLLLLGTSGALIAQTRATVSKTLVTVGDSYFSPQEVTILVGTTVVWMNNGTLTHTTTSDTGLWRSGPIQPGSSYQSPPFTSIGVFNYHGESNQITGKVIVVASSATALYPGSFDSGLVASFIIALLFAMTVIFWLNYPSSKARARAR